MRTTLKRGIGRAGGPNGNGHSAMPPLFTSVNRYSQTPPPRRTRRALILRGFGWFVLALVVIGAGTGGGFYLYTHETLGSLNAKDKPTQNAAKKLSVPEPGHAAIALVAGYDHRAGTGTGASYSGSNSDTLMLLRADPVNHTLSLLSFPRDLNVPIYCKGEAASTTDRINAAWADCGASGGPLAAVDTMEHLTGLKINYLITLDFRAFKQVVNQLHGVYMNVDRRYYNPPHNGSGYSAINLQPGYQKLDGGEALSYVRFRHLDSDIYRNGRQQLFLEALKSRLKSELSVTDPVALLKLVHVLKGNLEYVKAGGAPVGISEIQSYLGLMYHLPPGHLFRNSIPLADFQSYTTPGGADELKADPSVVAAVVHKFLNPDVPAAQKKPTTGSGSKHVKKLAHKDVSVLVLNGGNTAGRAANTSFLLKKQGFAVTKLPASTPANAPRVTHSTFVYYNAQQATGKQAAAEVAPLFGAHTVVLAMPPSIGALARKARDPLVVVAFGTSFSGKLTLPHTSKPVTGGTTPASVQDGLPVTLSAVRAQNGPAHFPLMVPKQVALGSSLSTDEGVRLFKPLRGKQELALTFNLNGGVEYWQIEESNWVSAPILQNPTAVIPWHHEKLDVYTSSGAIQMVAVRTPKAAYWVVNTILNDLSNSTMMAIAESLTPLR
jgi:LCP family protein required for cell wall assembly